MKQYSSRNCYAGPIAASAHAPKVAQQQMRGLLVMTVLLELVRACSRCSVAEAGDVED